MTRLRAIFFLLGAAIVAGATIRQTLWDLDLSMFVSGNAEKAEQIWGIRFSPDETKIAIGYGPYWNFDPGARHIVIVSVNQPKVAIGKFDLNIKSQIPSAGSFTWSPSGKMIVVASPPLMVRFDAVAPCAFPEDSYFGGFLSGDRMVLMLREPGEIRVLAPDCSVTDEWVVEPHAYILDTSPEKGLIAIYHGPLQEIALLDAVSHEIKQNWKWKFGDTYAAGFLFANQGAFACSGVPHAGRLGPSVACWNTQTGSKFAETQTVAVDRHGINSSGGGLLALTDYKYISHQGTIWKFLDMANDYSVPLRHLIWNIRTGEEVTSWGRFGNFNQAEQWGVDPRHTTRVYTETVLSLSPSGRYIAEGGSGSVSVHVLKP
jgi:hypothetical protein